MTTAIENTYKNLVNALNRLKERKCVLYSVKYTSDCDYSTLSDSDKKEADFLDLIENDIENALSFIKLEIYGK